jgi:hypothetical protein
MGPNSARAESVAARRGTGGSFPMLFTAVLMAVVLWGTAAQAALQDDDRPQAGEVLAGSAAEGEDVTAPLTLAELEGESRSPGIYNGAVTVRLRGEDDNVVSRTQYRLDGGSWTDYTHPEVPILDATQASFDKWRHVGSGSFVRLPDGSVVTNGGLGMLWYTGSDFGDVALKMQWRDLNGISNAGVFMRFPHPDETVARAAADRYPCQVGAAQTDPGRVAAFCGFEFQINDGAYIDAQATGSVYNFKPLTKAQARTQPPAEWVDYEVRTVGRELYEATVVRNGVVLNRFVNTPGQQAARAGDPPTDARTFVRGYVGLQNHIAGDLIQFRNIVAQDLSEPDPIVVAVAGTHTIEFRSTDAAGNVEEPRSVTFTIV